jgi:aerobic carbon-monoxide dehydrogenase small subunit
MVTRTLFRGGVVHVVASDGDASLLDIVRRELGARSTARGCSTGVCGSCRVILNSSLVNACAVMWADVPEGARLETAEDIDREPSARRVLAAFERERPTRCRLCVAGLAATAVDLARRGLARNANAIDEALGTSACMCTGRGSLRRALLA